MQLSLNPKSRRSPMANKPIVKIVITIVVVLIVIFFLGKLELSTPKKLIKQEISNDKLIKLK